MVMAEVSAVTREQQEQYGFAGTAEYPHPQAYRATLKGAVVNSNDAPVPTGGVSGPGASTDVSADDKKG